MSQNNKLYNIAHKDKTDILWVIACKFLYNIIIQSISIYSFIFSLGRFQTTHGLQEGKRNSHLTATMTLVIAIQFLINCYYKISVADVIMNKVS